MEEPAFELVDPTVSGEVEKYDLDNDTTLQSNPCYGDMMHDTLAESDKIAEQDASGCGVKISSRDWRVFIGLLVLVGVVACVSIAVAVCSIAKVNSINSMLSTQIALTQSSLGRIGDLNATFSDASDLLRSDSILLLKSLDKIIHNVDDNFTSSVNYLRSEIIAQNSMQRLNDLNNSVQKTVNSLSANAYSIVELFTVATQAITGQYLTLHGTSCISILSNFSSAPSGHYWVSSSNGSAVSVYCDMTRSCGGVTGGWMRVTSLDFSDIDSSVSCPSGLRAHIDSDIRTCGIQSSSAACASVMFSTSGVPYSRVCGKVTAYQYGSTGAFSDFKRERNPTIDSNYVDGVSLTHGSNPREHIWTFAAALDEYGDESTSDAVCECSHSGRRGGHPPIFVGQDYFCDSGRLASAHGSSPLWDGTGCGLYSTCCSFNNPPWFYKQLPSSSDAIEMRVCSDESRSNEDIAMSSVEIYIQ